MPRKSRRLLGETVCHHMVQGINKEEIFKTEDNKEKYIELLKKYYKEFKIDIIAYCIMDNHVHMLINVQKIEDMCRFMQQVNTSYARFYNKFYGRVGYVFRNRYLSKSILDERQLKKCIVYIHKNPVVAEMVKKEEDYSFSSYNEYLQGINTFSIISSNAREMLFGDVSSDEFKNYFKEMHNYKDYELKEFDDFEEKEDLEKIINRYSKFSDKEKIIKLNVEEKFSERKLAEIFKMTRYEIRKILKQGEYTDKTNKPN
mgnify:CR=1 FL=1